MITNYNLYLKENKNLTLYDLLINIIDDINKSFNFENKDFKVLTLKISENNEYMYSIISNISSISTLDIDIKNNNINLEIIYKYIDYYDNFIININDINLESLLKEKILLSYIISIIYDQDFLIKNNINFYSNIDKILLLFINNNINYFISCFKYHLFPINIENKYKYILDANNFDLI